MQWILQGHWAQWAYWDLPQAQSFTAFCHICQLAINAKLYYHQDICLYLFIVLPCFTQVAACVRLFSSISHFDSSEKLDVGLVWSICKLKVGYKQGERYQHIAKVFACLLACYFVLQCGGPNPGPCRARQILYHWAASQPCKLQFKHRDHLPSFMSSLPPLFIPWQRTCIIAACM